jgi:sulfate adenylyltransferase (ADP) / ATP adenylyltransferase
MFARIRAVSTAALETGALVTIDTESRLVTYESRLGTSQSVLVGFLVRKVANLSRKDAATARARGQSADPVAGAPSERPADFNPFLPYESAMYVQHIPPSHVLLLNKFNVVDAHTLVVTERYEEQSSLLTADDFSALWSVLGEVDGLGFYNAGRTAGASQRHKHLQVVPVPLVAAAGSRTPFDAAYASQGENPGAPPTGPEPDGTVPSVAADRRDVPGTWWSSPHLPFLHAVVSMRDCAALQPSAAAARTMQRYTHVLHQLDAEVAAARHMCGAMEAGTDESMPSAEPCVGIADGKQPFPYNLLLTREYMVMVPRRREHYVGDFEGKISVNSLGFAGCLLVRNEEQLRAVTRAPMDVLAATAFPVATGL